MSTAETITTGWTASTYPAGRAAFFAHLNTNWTEIVRQADEAFAADRARPEFALEQWLAFERDYHHRILADQAAERDAA